MIDLLLIVAAGVVVLFALAATDTLAREHGDTLATYACIAITIGVAVYCLR